ncbi:MAG: hypothetical protein PHU85_00310 [Phycisphaerae bacterium]|nr:hypothetical protein [Phycisphaerae bacterium]
MGASPATLASWNETLRNVYLNGVRDAVYTDTPFLDILQKKAPGPGSVAAKRTGGLKTAMVPGANGSYGLCLEWNIHVGRNFGVGARNATSGQTTGWLPLPGSQTRIRAQIRPTYYWGGFKIDGALLDTSKGAKAAALEVIDGEMQGLPLDVRNQINRDLYGDGTGILAIVTAGSSGSTITVDSTRHLEEGQPIVLATATGTSPVAATIATIVSATQFTVGTTPTVTTSTRVFRGCGVGGGIHDPLGTPLASEYGNAIKGLDLLVGTGAYAGITRTGTNAKTAGGSYLAQAKSTWTVDNLFAIWLAAKQRCNAEPNVILCDANYYTNFGRIHYGYQQWPSAVKKSVFGYPALHWLAPNGQEVPLIIDLAIAPWTGYMLDSEALCLGVERELGPMNGDDQTIVRSGALGPNGEHANAYESYWYTSCQLLAMNPGAQSKNTINPSA